MVRFVPLSLIVLMLELEAITRILYPVPFVDAGIALAAQEIVPAVVPVSVPSVTGEVKDPAELLNCAVKTLPAFTVAAAPNVKVTLNAPTEVGQIGLEGTVVVVIDFCACPAKKNRTKTSVEITFLIRALFKRGLGIRYLVMNV
jgi:hypothetical protein